MSAIYERPLRTRNGRSDIAALSAPLGISLDNIVRLLWVVAPEPLVTLSARAVAAIEDVVETVKGAVTPVAGKDLVG